MRKIREKMAENISNAPGFMCSTTIDRTERTGKEPPTGLPELRLAAGIVNGKELYSMPSSPADQELLKKILGTYGRAGTGSFAMYGRAVFLTTAATFYDGPEETVDGRTLSRLDFAMPREVSHYILHDAGKAVEEGYTGSIWTDPRSLEVARVVLQSGEMPAGLGLKSVTQTVDYARSPILGVSMLLPAASDLVLVESAGKELRVTAHFSDCHQYTARKGEQLVENLLESPVAATTTAKAAESAPVTRTAATATASTLPSIEEVMPARTPFEMMLENPIDERTTTDGTKLSFTVWQDVKKKDGKVMLPKGAKATGHVTRIIRQSYVLNTSLKEYYLVGMQLDTIDVAGSTYRISADLERVGPPAEQICFIPYSHNPLKWGQFDDIYTLFLVPPAAPGESFLGVVAEFLRLGNWRSYWTVRP